MALLLAAVFAVLDISVGIAADRCGHRQELEGRWKIRRLGGHTPADRRSARVLCRIDLLRKLSQVSADPARRRTVCDPGWLGVVSRRARRTRHLHVCWDAALFGAPRTRMYAGRAVT
jgi:hypothetical protein